jgi:two-component system, LuxR family, response regulator FixJ
MAATIERLIDSRKQVIDSPGPERNVSDGPAPKPANLIIASLERAERRLIVQYERPLAFSLLMIESSMYIPTIPTLSSAPQASDCGTPLIYVIEDDPALRDVLAVILERAGYDHATFDTAAAALASITPRKAGCLLIDLSLPDMPGLDLRKRLLANGCRQPFLVITGTKDMTMVVQAMQEGALDLLQKPVSHTQLLNGVARAVERDCQRRCVEGCIDSLTVRERDVLRLVAEGQPSKEIARQLCISPRTVDVHRHHILKKTGAQSFGQLLWGFQQSRANVTAGRFAF